MNIDILGLLLKRMVDLQAEGLLPKDLTPQEALEEWMRRKIEKEYPLFGDGKVQPEDIAPEPEQMN